MLECLTRADPTHYTIQSYIYYIFPMIPGSADPRHSCANILFKILSKSFFSFIYSFLFA